MHDEERRLGAVGCPLHSTGNPTGALTPATLAARAISAHSLTNDQLAGAVAVLEQAFELNPSDATGEISAILGRLYFHQQRYGDAVRHLEAAAAKSSGDENTKHILARAVRNCETSIERPTAPFELTDAARIVTPPAVYLREPEIKAPLPFVSGNPWSPGSWVGKLQGYGGVLAAVVVGIILRGIRIIGTNDDRRSAWERRKGCSVF